MILSRLTTLITASLFTVLHSAEILLESFENPQYKWVQMNDPVMGGKSTGTFSIENNSGVMRGNVAIVPFLQGPGFIKAETYGDPAWPNISSCSALKMTVMSSTEYDGYRVSFGKNMVPGGYRFVYGYKADFSPPVGSFGDVEIPFTDFSYDWDPATGDQITTCNENPSNCPDDATLKDLHSIAIWGEGVEGDVLLEIKSISASDCSDSVSDTTETVDEAIDAVGDSTISVDDAGVKVAIEPIPSPDDATDSVDDDLPDAVGLIQNIANMVNDIIDKSYGTPPPTPAPTEANGFDDIVNTISDAIGNIRNP